MIRLCAGLVVAFFVGCGSSERHGGKGAAGSTGDAGQDSGSHASGAGGADSGEGGMAALASFAPSATLMYNPTLGTLQFVSGLDIELTGCVDDEGDVYAELWPVLASAPELFQIDAAEWEAGTSITSVRAEMYDYVTFFQCNPTGSGTYSPTANDQVSFGDMQITWDEINRTGRSCSPCNARVSFWWMPPTIQMS